MSEIQAVLFNVNYWNTENASIWLYNHHLYPIKPFHITKNFIRARIHEPSLFKRIRTIKTNEGIDLIIGFY